MPTPDIILIDINGLGYASMYVPALSRLSYMGQPTAGIYGGVASMLTVMAQQPQAVPIVLWDAHCQWRRDIYEEYKGNRADTPEKLAIKQSYALQVPHMQHLISAFGIPQIRCHDAEADDLGGAICQNIDPSWKIELATKDTDWFQSIRQNVWWNSPAADGRLVDLAALANPATGHKDGHFLSPGEYLECKAFAGDTSDNIPGIPKVGLKTAAAVLRAHGGDAATFWKRADNGTFKPKGVREIAMASEEGRSIFARNTKLMDWARGQPLRTDHLAITALEPDWALAEDICASFGIKKILRKAQEVVGRAREAGNWTAGLRAVDRALHAEHCQASINERSLLRQAA